MMNMRWIITVFACLVAELGADAQKPVEGKVPFRSAKADQIPELFRLKDHDIPFQMKLAFDLSHSGVEIWEVQFPSPVQSASVANNTVHALYFKPKQPGKHPGVIVLDILDGKQVVARSQALWLAQNNIATLVVYMAHYGPRRTPGSKDRLLSGNVDKTVENVKQTVLDCRCAVAWLEQRPEINDKKLSVIGTSLGSFIGGLVAAAEPRIRSACLCLSGGDFVESFANHPSIAWLVPVLQIAGVNANSLKQKIGPIDPITYASILKTKRMYYFAASRDDVVPPEAMKRLWEATGKPPITWVDATHIGAALYMFPMIREIEKHIRE